MILCIDNFDSFTFNLVQVFQQLGTDPVVLRNNEPRILDLARDLTLSGVIISPGPGHPRDAGLCLEFLKRLPHHIPVLGVCLGHQVLGVHAGAEVSGAERIMHGKSSHIEHDGQGLFAGLPQNMEVARYHSLIVHGDGGDIFEVTCRTESGEPMGLRFLDRPWRGVQFHPESILTPQGPDLLANFLSMCNETTQAPQPGLQETI